MSGVASPWFAPFRIGGMEVVVSPLVPESRWTGPVVWRWTGHESREAVEEFNAWAAQLFGGEKVDNIFVLDDRLLVMGAQTYARLRNHMNALIDNTVFASLGGVR
jgi:hypothetical protein